MVPIVLEPDDFMVLVSGDPLRTNAYAFTHNGYLGFPVRKEDSAAEGLVRKNPQATEVALDDQSRFVRRDFPLVAFGASGRMYESSLCYRRMDVPAAMAASGEPTSRASLRSV